jgi:hypothetical protein
LTYRLNSTWRTVIALCFLSVIPAKAGVILSIESVSADQNTTGNFFDVLLTNTGPSDVTIDSFAFGFLTTNVAIDFTDVTTSTTAAYIFAGNSLFGPDLTGPFTGQSVNTSDLAAISAVLISSGSTVGLGHVFFSVGGGAPGDYGVDFVPLATSLADAAGDPVAITTLQGGIISIASTVPEPSSLASVAFALLVGLCTFGGTRRSRRSKSTLLGLLTGGRATV